MITVVVPVYNRADLVERTLRSIAAQTLRPRKVVLVDNASTDGTLEVLRRWAQTQPQAVVVSEAKPGAAAARNRGLQEVDTPYVMFYDSDDLMPPRHVEEVTAELRRRGLPQIGYFPALLHNLDGTTSLKRARGRDVLYEHIFSAVLSTLRMVATADLVRRVGGWNEEMLAWDDYELGVRLLLAAQSVEPLTLSRPVDVMLQAESITGVTFSQKQGLWERSLDAIECALRNSPQERYAPLVDYRRAILSGHYRREGNEAAARELFEKITHRRTLMRLVAAYAAHGGRGVHYLARYVW
jgi:glycosyltransferase involved in cell wall biosynthesis